MWKDTVVPVTSVLVALAGVLSGVYVQRSAALMQFKTKEYEVSFWAKQHSYADVVRLLGECQQNLIDNDRASFTKNLTALQGQYLSLEPFIKDKATRDSVWQIIITLRSAASVFPGNPPLKTASAGADQELGKRMSQMFDDNVRRLREILYKALFESND